MKGKFSKVHKSLKCIFVIICHCQVNASMIEFDWLVYLSILHQMVPAHMGLQDGKNNSDGHVTDHTSSKIQRALQKILFVYL